MMSLVRQKTVELLQFGHACLRVETCLRSPAGHRLQRFNSATPACAWRRLAEKKNASRKEGASIRPRLLARGDGERWRPRTDIPSGFNSATPACAWRHGGRDNGSLPEDGLLQFGHACLRVETSSRGCSRNRTPPASIRPRLLARGDRRASDCHATRCSRFNSATPACAWRLDCYEELFFAYDAASIRPRLLARGDERGNPSHSSTGTRFNSATPACAWRLVRRAALEAAQKALKLQFGHACLRVETAPRVGHASPTGIASIRPRLLARGDRGRRGARPELQVGFNSATPACAWRLDSRFAASAAFMDASIRPRLLARGDEDARIDEGEERSRFNSATPACAWRPVDGRAANRPRIASIRPRLLARGDRRYFHEFKVIRRASIRPRLLARGDSVQCQLSVRFGDASIRPRLLARGDVVRVVGGLSKSSSFNSATPACAWRLGISCNFYDKETK